MSDYTPHSSEIAGHNPHIEQFYDKGAISPGKNVFQVPIDRFIHKYSGRARELTGENPAELPTILYLEPNLTPYDDMHTTATYSGKSKEVKPSGVERKRDVKDSAVIKTGKIPWSDVNSILIADGSQKGLEEETVSVRALPRKFAQ
jgi:hypothetical protein